MNPTSLLWFPPLRDSERHFADGFHPIRNRRVQSVDGTHVTSEPYQVCRYRWWNYPHSKGTPRACQNTPNQTTLLEKQVKHSKNVWSSRYYLNINCFYSNNIVFTYVYMYCFSRINMNYEYLAYNCTYIWCIHEIFLIWIIPSHTSFVQLEAEYT